MEEGYVRLTRPTENLLKVYVMVFQPGIDEEGSIGTYEAFKATYKWVEKFKTLVATNCYHSIPPDEPVVKDVCATTVKTVSHVLEVMVSADISNTDGLDLPKVAQCIKSRLVQTKQREWDECFITALDEGIANADEAVKEKIQ